METKRLIMVSKIKLFFLILLIAAAPAVVHAQTHFDDTEPDGGDISDTPVNGGVALLLISGLGLGAITIYKVVKKNQLTKVV